MVGPSTAQAQPKKRTVVTMASACSCPACGGKWRWPEKTDKEQAPASVPADHQLTPALLAQWSGPGGKFRADTPRGGKELEWFELKGKIRHARVEKDGDITLELSEIGSGKHSQLVSVEIPDGEPWCAARTRLFSVTGVLFPFSFANNADLPLRSNPVISVTGHAFYDAEHDDGDSRVNSRKGAGHTVTTVWEIHPVMRLDIVKQ